MQSQTIRVMTLNIWGLWLVSKKRKERVRFLGDHLQSTDADLVLLQEVWVDGDAQLLVECAAKAGLRHAMHFKGGIFGSGLVTISRFPIMDSAFWRYSAAGDPAAINCGDFYAAKGVGWLRVDSPGGPLDVFNTHLHANYSHKYEVAAGAGGGASISPSASGSAAGVGVVSRPRVTRQPARVLKSPTRSGPGSAGSPRGALLQDDEEEHDHEGGVLLGGRDGTGGGTSSSGRTGGDGCSGTGGGTGGGSPLLTYRIPRDAFAPFRICQMLELASMVRHIARPGLGCDSLGVILGGDLNSKPDSLEIRILQVLLPELRDSWVEVHGESEPGYTCHAPGNTYQPRRQVAERIDYVLATPGDTSTSAMRIADCQTALQRTAAGFSYSDHFAVTAELHFHQSSVPVSGGSSAAGAAAAAAASRVSMDKRGGGGGGGGGVAPMGLAAWHIPPTLRHDVLGIASRLLTSGSVTQAGHARARLLASIALALLAMFLSALGHLVGWRLVDVASDVAAVVCGGLAVILFLMGFMADNTQRRALLQARDQLRHITEQRTL